MRRSVVILLGTVLGLLLLFVVSRQVTALICQKHLEHTALDDLEWLRLEFHLGETEMAAIRKLHVGYRPQCQDYCQQIAAARAELDRLLKSPPSAAVDVQTHLEKVAQLRAQCQAAMLRHFAEVSRVMPPEQGRRYWEEMSRLVVGAHEEVEKAMRGGVSSSHGHGGK